MLGDNVEIGCNSVLNPGTVIGKNTNIYPLSCVRGVIPENSIYKNEKIVNGSLIVIDEKSSDNDENNDNDNDAELEKEKDKESSIDNKNNDNEIGKNKKNSVNGESNNPETGDNIIVYVIFGILSLLGLTCSVFYFRKNKLKYEK